MVLGNGRSRGRRMTWLSAVQLSEFKRENETKGNGGVSLGFEANSKVDK